MTTEQETGRLGEELACQFLIEQGYRIIETNFACHHGEIDIVAEEKGDLVFIEVKCRTGPAFVSGLASVTRAKQLNLIRAARSFMRARRCEGAFCRFDVIEVHLTHSGNAEGFELVRGAFVR